MKEKAEEREERRRPFHVSSSTRIRDADEEQECGWIHMAEGDARRCWNCGAIDHFANACTRPKEEKSSKDGGKGKGGKGEGKAIQKATKESEETASTTPSKETTVKEDVEDETNNAMKGLLEEANKMLKNLQQNKAEDREEREEGRLEKLQKQLDELKALKVLSIAKIMEDQDHGLLEPGATHAL